MCTSLSISFTYIQLNTCKTKRAKNIFGTRLYKNYALLFSLELFKTMC